MLSRETIQLNMLYPPLEPFSKFFLKVSDLHTLYVEEIGHPQGVPLVFLHGGPGSGLDKSQRQFFNPKKFRVILFDQRGCGQSQPYSCLEANTTSDLVEDIELIRKHLGIEAWHVFGGSWGSFLALAYAQKYTRRVLSLILRGLFLGSKEEIQFFYQKGASFVFPEAYELFTSILTEEEKKRVVYSFYKRLASEDQSIRLEAARHWAYWEASCLRLINTTQTIQEFAKVERILSLAAIETHYFVNDCFIQNDQLIHEAYKLKDIPITCVHGRYDMICPFQTAYRFKQELPHVTLIEAPSCGHSGYEPGILEALGQALDKI